MAGSLGGHVRLSGHVRPGIPSYAKPYTRNVVTINLSGIHPRPGDLLRMRGLMIGMVMKPLMVVLTFDPKSSAFNGAFSRIPMFGNYHFTVTLSGRDKGKGTATLSVPLP